MRELKHGDILPETFRELFPEDVYELIVKVSRAGFGLTLVGGAVRDFLLNDTLAKDLDFELRHSFEYSEDEWLKMIIRLSETLKQKHSYYVEVLPFSIIKIKLGSFDIELSSPREETYAGDPPFGHSEFEVQLNAKLSYEKSFERRDFTLNALGVEFGMPGADDEFKFIDPYNGIEDLKEKRLVPCGPNYYNDPVRFLRLIRFKDRFGFEFVGDITKFDLNELTPHYFFQEGLKNFFPIVREFYKEIAKSKLNLSIDLKDLSFLMNQDLECLGDLSKTDVLMVLTFMKDSPKQQERADFVRLASMKMSSVEDYESLCRNLGSLKHITDSSLRRKLRHNTFLELLDDEDLKRIKVLHQIYNRHRFGVLEILKKINPEAFKVFTYFKVVFGEETKGKIVASKLMDLVKEKEKRSVISIYCHLLVYFDLRPVLPESRFGN